MSKYSIFRRFRTIIIALGVTLLTNYGISMAVDGGVSGPLPRPQPLSIDESGVSAPPPRPVPMSAIDDSGVSSPPPRP